MSARGARTLLKMKYEEATSASSSSSPSSCRGAQKAHLRYLLQFSLDEWSGRVEQRFSTPEAYQEMIKTTVKLKRAYIRIVQSANGIRL